MREEKRLIKNTGIIAIGNLSTKLITFLLLPLYTSILSTSEYGTIDYIVSIASFCIPFVSFLMDESVFRFLIDCGTKDEEKRVISTAMGIALAGCVLFCAIAVPVLRCVNYLYPWELIGYVLSFTLSMMVSAILRGTGRTGRYALFNFLAGAATVVFNVVFIAALRWGVRGMMLAYILGQAVVAFAFIAWDRMWRWIDFRGCEGERVRSMVAYSLPLIPNKISWTIINLSDRLVIINTIGSSAAGLYAVAYKFPTLMDTVYGFFYQAWKESSARVLGDEQQDVFYNRIYACLKDFMYSVVLGMTAFMPLVFRILINAAYSDALMYVPILLLGMYFSNMSAFYGGIFTAYKDTRIMGTTTAVAAAINLVINLALIRTFGLYAAAISTLAANLAVYFYRKMRVRKYIVLKENRRKQLIALAMTALILAAYYARNGWAELAACLLAVGYALVMNREMLSMLCGKLLRRDRRSK